jgi:AraC family transcriptional regulator
LRVGVIGAGAIATLGHIPGLQKLEGVEVAAVCDANAERILLSLLPELGTDGLGGELYAESLATALAVQLLRVHSSLGERAKRRMDQEPRHGLPPRSLRLVLDYVEANLAGDLSLAELAAVAGVSPRHLLRLFKRSTGLPPHRYVIGRRVEQAKGLLSGSDAPLWRVAKACGFAHQQHLSTHFKRLVGVSPGRYRDLHSR